MSLMARSRGTIDPRGALTVVRELPFVEFIELLEFSHLRFDLPKRGSASALVGSQEWQRQIDDDAAQPGSVYVCSTLQALHHAVLAPENAELKIDMPSPGRVRLRTLSRQHRSAVQPCVRVDLQALILRVLVPSSAPAHLFDLVRHVVMTRLWVEVARVSSSRNSGQRAGLGRSSTEIPMDKGRGRGPSGQAQQTARFTSRISDRP